MDTQQASTTLLEPLRTAASALRGVSGARAVTRATEGALDRIGAASPQERRIAVHTGAGLLGVAGVVEWPVDLTGAAVARLTRPKPQGRRSTSAGDGRATSCTHGRAAATQTRKPTAPAKKATGPARKSTGQNTKSNGPASRPTGRKNAPAGRGKSTARDGSTGRRSSATG